MLPLPDAPLSSQGVAVPPPPSFRAIGSDSVLRASFSALDHFNAAQGNSPARKAGLRYEKDVHRFFQKLWKSRYRPHPWIQFITRRGRRYCCPDGLAVSPSNSHVIIVEIKLRHTSDAWWQLRKLYEPVLRRLYGVAVTLDVLEVVRHYDPATPFPEEVRVLESAEAAWDLRGVFGVFPWKK